MITAVDINVLLDVFGADPAHGPASRAALRDCIANGGIVACEVVWAEVTGFFASGQAAEDAMAGAQVTFSAIVEDHGKLPGVDH